MDGLIVKQPYAGMIIDGSKTWELRNRHAPKNKIGVTIFLLSQCYSLGIIRITESSGPIDIDKLDKTDHLHHSGMEWPPYTPPTYAWKVEVVKRFKQPKRYAHPNGAQIWVKNVVSPENLPKTKITGYFNA